MSSVAAAECALALGAVVQCCLDTEMLQWLLCFPHSALVSRDSHRPGFVLCQVPGVAGYIPVTMTCFIQFLFLTASFKILKW